MRHKPPEERVSILAIAPLTLVMPLSYALQTPLALFTLESGSWETAGAVPSAAAAGA